MPRPNGRSDASTTARPSRSTNATSIARTSSGGRRSTAWRRGSSISVRRSWPSPVTGKDDSRCWRVPRKARAHDAANLHASRTSDTVRLLHVTPTDGGLMDPQQVLQSAQDAITARRVFGEPFEADGATILPVAVVRGGGRGGARGQDGAIGYGLGARPAGVYVIRNGRVSWRPAVNVNMIVAGGQLVAIVALFVPVSYTH